MKIHVELSDECAARWKRWLRADAWNEMVEVQRAQSRLNEILARADEQRKLVDSAELVAKLSREMFESIFGPMPNMREGTKWIYPDGHEEE